MRNHHSHDWQSHQRRRIVLGLCFVLGGILALLGNLRLIDIGNVSNYWPLLFCVIGLVRLTHPRRVSGVMFGLGLIALGVGLTLQKLGLVHHVMAILIPIFLILGGIGVIVRGFMPRRSDKRCNPLPPPSMEHKDSINSSAIMGGANVRCDSPDFKGGELNAIMGGIELDLRQASIQSQAVLRVYCVAGGIAIRIPTDWQVVRRVSSVLGGVDDKTIPPMQADKTLLLQGEVIIGGIEIKN
ncbi:LiaF transmembrane domain-containing protein [Paludibacterium yongneupense]|uniref:LiaF transmembrane domain-containing protein n=1 Tax=Paludibacterium yongneupense TaxID=400061 RepID=UPI00040791D6|nr:LiaF domain-containing protein [Paludibacterium yongneupense]